LTTYVPAVLTVRTLKVRLPPLKVPVSVPFRVPAGGLGSQGENRRRIEPRGHNELGIQGLYIDAERGVLRDTQEGRAGLE
jgi:hypothetical protein